MRRTASILIVLAWAAVACAAQAQTPPATPEAAVRLQLARQMFEANGGGAALQTQMKAMFSGISSIMKTSLPPGNDKLADALMKDFSDEEMKWIPELIEDSAQVYADHLSEQELRDMLAWTNSPSARSIREKMPAIMQESMMKLGPHIQAMMPTLMHRTIDRSCEESHCTPEMKASIQAALDKVLKPPAT